MYWILGCLTAWGQATGLPTADKLIEAFNTHEAKALGAMVSSDFEMYFVSEAGAAESQGVGPKPLEDSMRAYFKQFPDIRSRRVSGMDGPKFCSWREEMTWTSDGEAFKQTSLVVAEVADGKLKRVWYYPRDQFSSEKIPVP